MSLREKKYFIFASVVIVLIVALLLPGCAGGDGGDVTSANVSTNSEPSDGDGGGGGVTSTTDTDLKYGESFFGVFDSHNHDQYQWFKNAVGLDEQGFYEWADAHQSVLKFHWSRIVMELAWEIVEPDLDGNYEWDNIMDAGDNIQAFRKTGRVNLWLVLTGDRLDGIRWQDHKEEFQDYVRACVERYDGDGIEDAPGSPTVKYWQAQNERGMLEDVPPDAPPSTSVEDYITYVTWMEEAVHQADPTARIILVANGTDGQHISQDMKDIIDGLVAAGVPFDVVDMHSWGPYFAWKMPDVEDAREFLDSRGLTDVEIWSGENGTWVGKPKGSSKFQTEADQARFLVKRYAYGPAAGLSKILWNNLCEWKDFMGSSTSIYNSMGLVGDGQCNGENPYRLNEPRIAYYAYAMLATAIDRPENEFVGEMTITDHNNLYGYEYVEKDSNRHKYIIWAESGEESVKFNVNSPSVLVTNLITDMDGHIQYQERIKAINGEISLTVDEDPLLVVELSREP